MKDFFFDLPLLLISDPPPPTPEEESTIVLDERERRPIEELRRLKLDCAEFELACMELLNSSLSSYAK